MSIEESKLSTAKVEKKKKRHEEKEAKKKLKSSKLKKKEKKEKKLLKKLEKELKKKEKKLKKLEKFKKTENSTVTNPPASSENKNDKEHKTHKKHKESSDKKQKKLKESSDKKHKKLKESSDKKHKKLKESSDKKHKKHEESSDKVQQQNIFKKPKLENVKKHIWQPINSVVVNTGDGLKKKNLAAPLPAAAANTAEMAVPTPTPTPVPQKTTINSSSTSTTATSKTTVSGNSNTTTVNNSTVRKPVSIRTPGSNREINPIYTKPPIAVNNNSSDNSVTSVNSEFIIPGVNDTEESRILARTFADRWILPANLYKIEASTGLKYRRGRFSDAEKLLAMKLTTKFCQEQNMSLERFKTVFFDDMGTENGHQNRLSNFFVDVSRHFGGRPVVAVYDFLKRLYHPGNHRGPWTPEEDEILLREYQKHGPKWTLIGKELNRLGINCRDRYNIRWKHEGKTVNGPWKSEEDEKLRTAIKESIDNCGTISWLWVSEERVKTRTPLQCLSRWKSIKSKIETESSSGSKTSPKKPKVLYWSGWKEDEDYLLIHSILTSGATSDESIQWKTLTVTGVPPTRHNPELFFRRWNHLKGKAEVTEEEGEDLKGCVEKVKRYLIKLSKSPAYIFSEDEEDDI